MKIALRNEVFADDVFTRKSGEERRASRRNGMRRFVCGTTLLLLGAFGSLKSQAQTCNIADTLNTANHAGVTANSGFSGLGAGVANQNNIIGATSSATTLASIVLGSAFVEVKKDAPTVKYPAGTYAGFNVTNTTLLGLLNNLTLTTYSNGVVQESVSGSAIVVSLGLTGGSNNYNVGFKTTKDFDDVRITLGGVLSSVDVYYAFVEKFCAGPALNCNTLTTVTTPQFPVTTDASQIGILGSGSVNSPYNIIDGDPSSYATISTTVGLATGGSIAIKDGVTTYPTGTFVAFDLSCSSLLGVNLLNNITITTYAAGVQQDVLTGAALLTVNPALLSASNGRSVVGFRAAHSFDEVKITVSNTLSLAYTVNIYGMMVENFCAGNALACNTLTAAVNPDLPLYVDGVNTGINNIATVGGSISNAQNAIDNDPNNYATVSLTTGVASVANFAVADAMNTYPANSFAGFDVETNTQLLTAGVLSNATIYLYNNGTLVQTGSGNALVIGATTTLLTGGTTRQIVGIVANVPYNEVKISFNQVVNADLGNIKIYSAILEKTCAPTIMCSTSYYLNNPAFPTVIDATHTGVSGVLTADASVADAWNVVSASTTDYARIANNATVLANASIAVLDPITTYPKGTFAGFVIKPGTTPAVLANLLNAITVSTYNNGTLQESATGASLINLTVLATLIGTPSTGSYNVGFYTTKPFDEITISVGSLLNAGLLNNSYVDVYGAFIDTRSSVAGTGTLNCMLVNPDVNTGIINRIIAGNVSTNDIIPGATYGTPAAPTTAPAGSNATLTVNADGSYTFTADKIGVYTYDVPYCMSGMSTGCATEPLTITVVDPTVNTNPPIVNTDLATTNTGVPVTISELTNDGVGNAGGTLGTPTITVQPSNGTAAVNASGQIVYTPNASFAGNDTITYQVCESPSGLCGTAKVYITVNGTNAAVSATDDYVFTSGVNAATGNVLSNDISTAGNPLTATTQNITLASGTFVLNANGTYSFTPVAGFIGTVDIPYQANDAATGTFAKATLHVVVNNVPDLSPTISFLPAIANGITNLNVLLTVYEENGVNTNGLITVRILKDPKYTLAFNSAATTAAGRAVSNSAWTFDAVSNSFFYILTTSNTLNGYGSLSAGFTATFNPNASAGSTIISTVIADGSGGETDSSDNEDDDTLVYHIQ
ncbi:beta strand repeat-containing protein [Taibaiella soli]|uniref:Tandem-95 repeat protein n=1 Tax=Taibaiella soli TaxID=1649169 RepID=A0A2W2ABI7_9BACT|nr:Ig-like domain-containing protein [Taibaiella soli]PZF70982.1 hypothetical protein DN068_19950 [Taibaiella soli]